MLLVIQSTYLRKAGKVVEMHFAVVLLRSAWAYLWRTFVEVAQIRISAQPRDKVLAARGERIEELRLGVVTVSDPVDDLRETRKRVENLFKVGSLRGSSPPPVSWRVPVGSALRQGQMCGGWSG